MQINNTAIKVAILDLYEDYPNEAINDFQTLLIAFRAKYNLTLTWQIFDVRGKNEVPGTEFDLYISSGGPGSPIDSEGSDWENSYFNLIDALDAHNRLDNQHKKHVLFVCHSFQLMCRKYKLGDVTLRSSESFGIYPVSRTNYGKAEVLFNGLSDPFFIVDSREWQVVNPDECNFKKSGAQLVAIEKERSDAALPRAMMAIRFNEYFFGTQFHPEANPHVMRSQLLIEDKKKQLITEYGEAVYNEILENLNYPERIECTYNTIIPNFLYDALVNI